MRHLTRNRWWLTLVTAADDLDTPVFEPAEEGLQIWLGYGADLVPYDDARDMLLAHPFRSPLSLATPAEEAVIGLGLYVPCSNLFSQTMCRSEHDGVSLAEQFNCSCGFATSSSTIQIAQLETGERIVVARCC